MDHTDKDMLRQRLTKSFSGPGARMTYFCQHGAHGCGTPCSAVGSGWDSQRESSAGYITIVAVWCCALARQTRGASLRNAMQSHARQWAADARQPRPRVQAACEWLLVVRPAPEDANCPLMVLSGQPLQCAVVALRATCCNRIADAPEDSGCVRVADGVSPAPEDSGCQLIAGWPVNAV